MLAGEELFGALDAVNQLPEVVAALERRGITGSDGLCLPRTVGRFFSDLANPVNDRLVRFRLLQHSGSKWLGASSYDQRLCATRRRNQRLVRC